MKNNPIRILHVLTTLNRGGAENMVMNYYRAIDKEKIQFDFLLHRYEDGAFEEEVLKLGGKIYKLPPITIFNYYNYKKLLNNFFKEHSEYTIVHSHLDTLSYIILKVAKKNNIKIRISHSHLAIDSIEFKKLTNINGNFKGIIKDIIKFKIRRKVLKQANYYFACSKKAGIWLFGDYNLNKIKIINNAINTVDFLYSKEKSLAFKKELGIENKKIIGHVGRFDEQKNHVFLIKIFNELQKTHKDCVLLLVGDGILKSKIENEVKKLNINDKVFFLGIRKDVNVILQAIDILLFPSLYEGLPVSLIEAQASGLKVITSNNVSSETAITDLVIFHNLENSPNDWANLVLKNLDYKRENMLNKIKTAKYDIESNAKELQDFYLKRIY